MLQLCMMLFMLVVNMLVILVIIFAITFTRMLRAFMRPRKRSMCDGFSGKRLAMSIIERC